MILDFIESQPVALDAQLVAPLSGLEHPRLDQLRATHAATRAGAAAAPAAAAVAPTAPTAAAITSGVPSAGLSVLSSCGGLSDHRKSEADKPAAQVEAARSRGESALSSSTRQNCPLLGRGGPRHASASTGPLYNDHPPKSVRPKMRAAIRITVMPVKTMRLPQPNQVASREG